MRNEEAFFKKRYEGWVRLAQLTGRADSSIRSLQDQEVEELVRLYRQASADLAFYSTSGTNPEAVGFLNELVARAHATISRRGTSSAAKIIVMILAQGSDVVRRRWKPIVLSLLLFVAGGVFSAAILTARPDMETHLIDPGMRPLFDSWASGSFEERDLSVDILSTAMYASNNPRVTLMQQGVAVVTAGIGTAIINFYNGMLIGSLSWYVAPAGALFFLWVSILPHGVTEIGGLVMAGAAGLVIGGAVFFPGRKSRTDALRSAGRDAFRLGVLAFLMTLIAAPIEGFLSFNPNVPDALRILVIVGTATFWGAYFVGYRAPTQLPQFGDSYDARKALTVPDIETMRPVATPTAS